ARFARALATAVAPDGTIYVTDEASLTIRRVSPAGQVTTLAGRAGFSGVDDGVRPSARFIPPRDLVVGADRARSVPGQQFFTPAGAYAAKPMGPGMRLFSTHGRGAAWPPAPTAVSTCWNGAITTSGA